MSTFTLSDSILDKIRAIVTDQYEKNPVFFNQLFLKSNQESLEKGEGGTVIIAIMENFDKNLIRYQVDLAADILRSMDNEDDQDHFLEGYGTCMVGGFVPLILQHGKVYDLHPLGADSEHTLACGISETNSN